MRGLMCRVLLGLTNLACSPGLTNLGLPLWLWRSLHGTEFTRRFPAAPVHSSAFKPPHDRPAHTIGL